MAQVLRRACVWAALLTLAVIGRDALDWWLAPTTEFYARSVVSTALAASIFAAAGLWAAARSRSLRTGVGVGVTTGLLAAIALNLISMAMLAVRHDPQTLAMIDASGGVGEVFLLPYIVLVPGTLCASAGAGLGKAIAWSLRSRVQQ